MQASRASSRAFMAIAAGSKQSRSLHMTGSATYSNLLNSERRALNLPHDIAGLQAECQKRNLPTIGSQNELLNRLTAHEMASSRAFSTAIRDSKRPTTTQAANPGSARHFNTSRSLKAVGDTSTIDFTYIPDFDPELRSSPAVRVPILPQINPSEAAKVHTAADGEANVVLPTVTPDSTSSAIGEAADNIFANFTSRFNASSDPENPSMVKELWYSFVEDIVGPKSKGSPKA
ncbi:hypothetical protein K504DRAFT_501929 [Pleomassaria siparia CBS 279.74]|uniref:SAP domain-containing protein n=1 Tax=Pleomassaria siparia CBS 279.74 TaxID=1314801 RepID=A0A6G1K9Z7_9PLEO|nr:hypothetical protein K504DRAFT_501929 [Pleomassaria siparia CBS 279.74]